MQGMAISLDVRGRLAIGLLTLALLMRLLIPAGWMPGTNSGYAITLCTGMGAQTAWMDKDGNVHKHSPADAKPDHPCAFSAFSAAFDLPSLDGMAAAPAPAMGVVIIGQLFMACIGRGLAAPPPPPTGPPATR